jgi:lipoate-protein ligase A
MTRPFRVIDTAIRAGARNIAFDAALIELHSRGLVRVDHCRANGIGLARRITGGGAIYMDEGQFGFELVFDKNALGISTLGDLTRELCEGVANGLGRLGVAAKFRPRNDIEVEGRKISGTGGFIDGNTVIFQGTILVEMDAQRMLGALNVPREKLAKRELDSAAQRIVTLNELLGAAPPLETVKQALIAGFAEQLDIAPVWGEIGAEEEALAARYFDEEIGTEDFLHCIDDPQSGSDVRSGSHMGAGGTVSAHVRLEGPGLNRVREILITGDFFVTPPRVIFDLESRLRGTSVSEVREAVTSFFAQTDVGLLTVQPEDFAIAIENALGAPARNGRATSPA